MASSLLFGAACLLSLWAMAKCADIPYGVLDMDCRDRYFIIAVDLSFTGDEPRFEAVDATGVYPISKTYAAECGYTLDVLPSPGHTELRASYFSCHADNRDDRVFIFRFNMITTDDEGEEVTYALNKTCSPSLLFSPREVTCEVNYMEVSVRTDVTCPSGTKKDDWNDAFTTAYDSATSDWMVMFQREGHRLSPMAISEARKQGYVFEMTDGRILFRTPYGQPHSFTNMVDGVSVESVHPTLFSRQSWVVLMVDLVATCSMHDGSYDGMQVMWQTPQVVPGKSGLKSRKASMGANGVLLEQSIVEERGYVIDESPGAAVQITVPYNAEGGYRQSFVMNNMYHEFFVFHLYFEQLFVDEDFVDTRLRLFRPLSTPLLSRRSYSVNQTVTEERVFAVYVGDFPEDVDLVTVKLNGQEFTLPLADTSSCTVSEVPQSNDTHGYILRLPFEDPVVITRLGKGGIFEYVLDINFTLSIVPENESFYHLTSVVAIMKGAFPPAFEGRCSETGISFKRDHRPFDYLWVVTIGPDTLTSKLAAEQGYNMHNDSQSLLLEVPLFSPGYTYENIGLKTFSGSVELLVRNAKTLEVQASSAITCSFQTTEMIVCSTDGMMAVVADMSMAIPGVKPSRITLRDRTCRPARADHARVMFSFPLNTCGTTVGIARDHVTYENEIIINQKLLTVKLPVKARNASDTMTVQCIYPLAGLSRLFSAHRFESDFPGEGIIVHPEIPIESLQVQHTTAAISSTTEGTTLQTTTRPTTTAGHTSMSRSIWGVDNPRLLAMHPPVHYVKVSRFLQEEKDLKDFFQTDDAT